MPNWETTTSKTPRHRPQISSKVLAEICRNIIIVVQIAAFVFTNLLIGRLFIGALNFRDAIVTGSAAIGIGCFYMVVYHEWVGCNQLRLGAWGRFCLAMLLGLVINAVIFCTPYLLDLSHDAICDNAILCGRVLVFLVIGSFLGGLYHLMRYHLEALVPGHAIAFTRRRQFTSAS